VGASTTTTIRGVSIFSRQRKRKTDVFDIALSPEGIAIQRPGRSDQYMGWDRVTRWEIEERPGCVVLTLRGGGSVTPLMVKDWTLDDLEAVMRDTTAGSRRSDVASASASASAPASAPAATHAFAEDIRASDDAAVAPRDAASPPAQPKMNEAKVDEPIRPRSARRQAARRPRRIVWRAVVTIVLLGVLAAAVVVILLQSAGVISWSFLGPTA
jgi:hypothetical protein